MLPENIATAEGMRNWVGHGLMVGRPLVIGTGLRWLWTLSLAMLVLYVILALLFRDATEHCIATLNDNPGKSLITAILAVLLTPLMMVLLAITLIGIPLIPIFLVTLFVAAIFGKTTVLGWIGGRCFGSAPGPDRRASGARRAAGRHRGDAGLSGAGVGLRGVHPVGHDRLRRGALCAAEPDPAQSLR